MAISSSADNIYLNLSSVLSNSEDILEFNTTFPQAVIRNPRDYYLSVVRFSIPQSALPNSILPIVENQPIGTENPNLTTLEFTVQIGGAFPNDPAASYYPQSVIYNTFGDAIPPNPVPGIYPNTVSYPVTQYYFSYSVRNILQMFNTALQTAILAAIAANPTAPQATSVNAGDLPYFEFDVNNRLLVFIANKVWATNINTNLAWIYINDSLLQYLKGFLYYSYNTTNLQNSTNSIFFLRLDYDSYTQYWLGPIGAQAGDILSTSTTAGGVTTTVQDNSNHFKVSQEFLGLQLWNPVKRVLITTDLPIRSEYQQVNSSDSVINNNNNITQLPILTDYVIDNSNSIVDISEFVYNPSGQYRLVDINTDQPIYNVQFKVFWSDYVLNVFPLLAPQHNNATLKIGFFKKDLYNGNVSLTKHI
jgi:hypothetical protein